MKFLLITKSYIHKEMTRGAKKAGVKRISIHGLRHSHISYLINRGFSAVAIGNRVGHESQSITFHYAHMFPTEQQQMAEVLNREFCDRMGMTDAESEKETKGETKVSEEFLPVERSVNS